MKILIVEDEQKTGNYLRQGLTEAGFAVNLARNGVDGIRPAPAWRLSRRCLSQRQPKAYRRA